MAETREVRRFWGRIGRAAAVVPVAVVLAAPALPALAAPAHVSAPAAVEPLTTIMNPPGAPPVGSDCGKAPLSGLKARTVRARLYCARTQGRKIVLWAYQFHSHKGYLAGVTHMNSRTGFSRTQPGSFCPPRNGRASGLVGWHAINNRKYKSRRGQFLECFRVSQKPVLIWTMPTQNVFFIAQDRARHATIAAILHWWSRVVYN